MAETCKINLFGTYYRQFEETTKRSCTQAPFCTASKGSKFNKLVHKAKWRTEMTTAQAVQWYKAIGNAQNAVRLSPSFHSSRVRIV